MQLKKILPILFGLILLISITTVFADDPVGNNSINNSNQFLFILGINSNAEELHNVSKNLNISSKINITIVQKENLANDINFSKYGVIIIESINETTLEVWTSDINNAKINGSKVIGYNLKNNKNLPNVDLYSSEYEDIERYWVQGGEINIENMVKFIGNKFSGIGYELIPEPEIIQPKINIAYIMYHDSSIHYLKEVTKKRNIITDMFNVTVMNGEEATNVESLSNQDVIIMYMIGHNTFQGFEGKLVDAKNNSVKIGLFGMGFGEHVTTFDMEKSPHDITKDYLYNGGFSNMENWIRCVGATIKDTYIEYAPPKSPDVPANGIYHPKAFPRIFSNSSEYLEWYEENGYNKSAPTIGIVTGNLPKEKIDLKTEDSIIEYLESNGINVIFASQHAFSSDVDYFVKNDEVLVDTIISLKGFYLNFGNQEKGVEYLQKYNVPILKAVQDYYQTPDEYYNSRGLDIQSIAWQITQPEIDGLTDFIWIAGRVKDPDTGRMYYEPAEEQVEWLCNRAISWANLKYIDNKDKKVALIYYNHGGGKDNIGASYLDVPKSIPLLLENMKNSGYMLDEPIPTGKQIIDMFIESRNVGPWAPGELESVVNSKNAILVPVEEYLNWYDTLPQQVKADIESMWGDAPGNIMVYENSFVIPVVQSGNLIMLPQPMRGHASDESILYHDKHLPPTHQYLATYFWINNIFDADAIIHFGTHGTQEWLPGKELGLWKYDYPSIMVSDTPVIYPYIMDNVGEGTQAKRRGNAVIIDHLIPAISNAGLYGDLAEIHDRVHLYENAVAQNNTEMAALYRETITEYYKSLDFETDLNIPIGTIESMTDLEFETFIGTVLHDHLHNIGNSLMPMGLHVFGTAPEGERLVSLVKSMLGNEFIDNIEPHIDASYTDLEDREMKAGEIATELLNEILLNGTDVSSVQLKILGIEDVNIESNLETALKYSNSLKETNKEIINTLRALNAEYITPGPGNDPIRNPSAIPTGKNFYSFDQRLIPNEETEAMGTILARQMLDRYYETHGEYPKNVAFVLWSVETMRHQGLMEAQIHALLGVKPVRSSGRVTGFKVIPLDEMNGYPRVDVTVTPSGLYRDTYPYQLELIDDAIRMVAQLNETNETNYVKWNSLKIEQALLEMGYNETLAFELSRARIFSEAPGSYGTGLSEAISASNTWDNEDKLAELYLSRMSHVYGKGTWGEGYKDVFRLNILNMDAAVHSRSSNLYGLMDNDDVFQYLGALQLTKRSLTGENIDLYIANLANPNDMKVNTLQEALRTELRSRYLNPKWIEGMMEHDYAGAREFMKFTEYMWGWNVVTPDLISDNDWNELHKIYVEDKYGIGVNEFMKDANPYAYQSMTSRMLETARKDYWDASDETLQNLANEYIKSVVEYGVTCCHHTCANVELNKWALANSNLDKTTLNEFMEKYETATNTNIKPDLESNPKTSKSSSSSQKLYSNEEIEEVKEVKVNETVKVNTTKTDSSSLVGSDNNNKNTLNQDSNTLDSSKKAYEVTVNEPVSSSSSSTTIIAIIAALGMTGLIGFGYFKNNPEILKFLKRK
ncbi:Cobaltochelatase [Methanococcus vannielii SB]|uniref:Cobaltochelatase n=1 Tax=Methanococcus vannielii (strain ATCC 35089 / DSM 1224 / JCM 13029 / OCM 148 / SB) TaxID=406327 RepID=A6USS8_METVS|nr:cobaltochelatase subunit CobN [Methanococcus vannielii]ABR55550.1 Cobaltochelatase [Methanococcus vannielii SB]